MCDPKHELSGGGVGVKPLVWDEDGRAETPFCSYHIVDVDGGYSWTRSAYPFHDDADENFISISSAKEDAQADYEQRIRSALTPSDATVAAAELEKVEEALYGRHERGFILRPLINCPTASAAVAELRKKVEELTRDTERLDWLISWGGYLSWSRDHEVCNVWLGADEVDEDRPAEGYPQKCYHDPREAIDAVRTALGDSPK